MVLPAADSYQAEILRHLHDHYHGELRDDKIGISRRIWNELGQRAGVNFPSVSGSLSILEARGSLVTEFGNRPTGGRMRVAVCILEEPPEGCTVFKGVQNRQELPIVLDGPMPTAAQVAAELLKLAVRAASVPVSDIEAVRHHNDCLREEMAGWVEMAEELMERVNELEASAEEWRTAVEGVTATNIEIAATNEELAATIREQEKVIAALKIGDIMGAIDADTERQLLDLIRPARTHYGPAKAE